MPPRATLVVSCPLESVSPLGGSKVTPGAAENSTRAPGTAAPLSSLTCTTTGCGNRLPVWAVCLLPLDSTRAAPKAVGLGAEAVVGWWEQEVVSRIRTRTTAATPEQQKLAELRSAGQPGAAVPT